MEAAEADAAVGRVIDGVVYMAVVVLEDVGAWWQSWDGRSLVLGAVWRRFARSDAVVMILYTGAEWGVGNCPEGIVYLRISMRLSARRNCFQNTRTLCHRYFLLYL